MGFGESQSKSSAPVEQHLLEGQQGVGTTTTGRPPQRTAAVLLHSVQQRPPGGDVVGENVTPAKSSRSHLEILVLAQQHVLRHETMDLARVELLVPERRKMGPKRHHLFLRRCRNRPHPLVPPAGDGLCRSTEQ